MGFFALESLEMSFGGLHAVAKLSLQLSRGDLFGLIGPNGAGKTTVFNLAAGYLKPTGGSILFEDREIAGLKPSAINALGIARTFQNIRLFQDLLVIENVMASYHGRLRSTFIDAVLRTPLYRREEAMMEAGARALLRKLELEHLVDQPAGTLPYGQQRKLEIARALATAPKLLLLDEPAAGMNIHETRELMEFILRIHEELELTILLIEHDMELVMGICQRIFVLEHGVLIAEGTPREVQNNQRVISAYLGE
jgi:branched-chain amino acid transport system ATP-binding protein